MKLKAKILEKLIDKSIDGLRNSTDYDGEGFAIHEIDGIQVQIFVTKDENGFCEYVLPEYEQADE